jgi:hypothetical protein
VMDCASVKKDFLPHIQAVSGAGCINNCYIMDHKLAVMHVDYHLLKCTEISLIN